MGLTWQFGPCPCAHTDPAQTPGEGLQTLPSSCQHSKGDGTPPAPPFSQRTRLWHSVLALLHRLSTGQRRCCPWAGHRPTGRRRTRGRRREEKNESPQKCLHNRKRLIKYLWFGMCDPTGQTMHLAGNPAINAVQSGISVGLRLAGGTTQDRGAQGAEPPIGAGKHGPGVSLASTYTRGPSQPYFSEEMR